MNIITLNGGHKKMKKLSAQVQRYLEYGEYQKSLNVKTIKAYRIDLKQFEIFVGNETDYTSRSLLNDYITHLRKCYKPKSSKRKIASLKAFFHYLEYEEIISANPFQHINTKCKEPFLLPKSLPLSVIEQVILIAYNEFYNAKSKYTQQVTIRNIAVLELLFSTGVRVSELCSLHENDVNLCDKTIKVYGKGAHERIVQLGNTEVINILAQYKEAFEQEIKAIDFFFVNRLGSRLSEQSVRFMIKRYAALANINQTITPHMFRHSFATLLLEEDVDIRYIQQLLGHSSITTTQIYTHVTNSKQRDILATKHPRNKMKF